MLIIYDSPKLHATMQRPEKISQLEPLAVQPPVIIKLGSNKVLKQWSCEKRSTKLFQGHLWPRGKSKRNKKGSTWVKNKKRADTQKKKNIRRNRHVQVFDPHHPDLLQTSSWISVSHGRNGFVARWYGLWIGNKCDVTAAAAAHPTVYFTIKRD